MTYLKKLLGTTSLNKKCLAELYPICIPHIPLNIYWKTCGKRENSTQQSKYQLISPTIKSVTPSPSNSNFHLTTYTIFICSCSNCCCIFVLTSGFIYTHVILILIDVYWMLSLALQKHWMVNVLPRKIFILLTFNAIWKTLLLWMLVFLLFTLLFFISNFLNIKFLLTPTPVWTVWANLLGDELIYMGY